MAFRETFFPTLLPLLVSPCWSSPCLKQMLQRTCKHLVAQNLSSGALLPIPSRTRLHIAHTMPKAPFDMIFRFYFAPCVASRKRVTPATNGVVCEVTQTSAQHCFRVSLLYRYLKPWGAFEMWLLGAILWVARGNSEVHAAWTIDIPERSLRCLTRLEGTKAVCAKTRTGCFLVLVASSLTTGL